MLPLIDYSYFSSAQITANSKYGRRLTSFVRSSLDVTLYCIFIIQHKQPILQTVFSFMCLS